MPPRIHAARLPQPSVGILPAAVPRNRTATPQIQRGVNLPTTTATYLTALFPDPLVLYLYPHGPQVCELQLQFTQTRQQGQGRAVSCTRVKQQSSGHVEARKGLLDLFKASHVRAAVS